MSGLIGNVRSSVGSTQLWISDQWTQRVVQVSVYTAVIFFILSSYPLINTVEKSVKSVSGLKLGKEGTLALHSVIFGLFVYVGTRFILDPLLVKAANGVVEGKDVSRGPGLTVEGASRQREDEARRARGGTQPRRSPDAAPRGRDAAPRERGTH